MGSAVKLVSPFIMLCLLVKLELKQSFEIWVVLVCFLTHVNLNCNVFECELFRINMN